MGWMQLTAFSWGEHRWSQCRLKSGQGRANAQPEGRAGWTQSRRGSCVGLVQLWTLDNSGPGRGGLEAMGPNALYAAPKALVT